MRKEVNYIFIVQVTRQLTIDIINNFIRQGASVHLITGIIESNYESLDARVTVTRFIRYNNKSNWGRLVTGLFFHLQTFIFLIFSAKNSELIMITTPPFIVALGYFFKRLRNQKYHLVVWDLYPDVLINFKVIKERSVIARVWKARNKLYFNGASLVFTLGRHLSEAIKKYTDKEPVIIPNWTNVDFIKPVLKPENPFVLTHRLLDKFIVMYSGNLGITHDLETIVSVAELLKNEKEIIFVIIGEGAKREKIARLIKEKELANLLLLPYQERETLPYSLGAADVGVITLGKGAEHVSVPSKTYYTLAAGAAVLALASPDSELGILIDEYACGKLFSGEQHNEIADFIYSLSKNKELLNQYRKNARVASLNFSPENAKTYYNEIKKI